MKRTLLLSLCIGMSVTLAAQQAPSNSARILEGYGKLPLALETNRGQSDPQVKFLSRGKGYSLFLTSNEAVLALQTSAPSASGTGQLNSGHQLINGRAMPEMSRLALAGQPSSASAVLRMKLVGANAKAEVMGQDELPGTSNYLIGNDPKKWHTNVRQFAKVRYANVYPGVDLVYYGNQRELEYDFVLQPGADPTEIRLGIAGAKKLRLNRGDLVLTSAGGNVHLRRPHIYQEANGVRVGIHGRYVIKSKNEVGFEVAEYDRRRSLVIDPVLAYSTYLGGSCCDQFNGDQGSGIAVDSKGNAYVTGVTLSTDFPTTNAVQSVYGGSGDAFVTKINADGNALVYSTYLGGSQNDEAYGIAVDSAGNAYVTGVTNSADFPTVNAIQGAYGGNGDAFVTKINAAGNALVYSTYLGGSELEWGGRSIAVDSAHNAYVTGVTYSSDFPTFKALQPVFGGGQYDAFVVKINAAGSALVYSTYLGGSGQDWGYGIAADSAGNAYVTGWTNSTDFPTAKAIQPNYGGGSYDAFVTKINAAGSALVYSTYLGGTSSDGGNSIATDSSSNAYVTGWAFSTDFPIVNAVEPVCCGGAFVTKFKADGSAFIYSTYLNTFSSIYSQGSSIAVDRTGNAYITGYTTGGFTTANAIQPKSGGGNEAFVTKLNADDSAFVYSTYLGGKGSDYGQGIAADASGNAYVVGYTYSANFPTTPVGLQLSLKAKGSTDSFVAKIAQQTFVSVSPAAPSFGRQVIGTTGAAKKITVTNQGSGTLTINKIYVAGLNASDFAETNTCGSTLAAGANCTISVTFTPTAKNTRKAGLGISSSDPASPNAIALSGTGTVVSLSEKSLSFGNQQVGTSSTPQSVTLTNVGSTPLNIKGISILGTNAGDFSQTNTCGSGIGAGADCTITLTFKPTATGTRKGAVSISDDGGGGAQQISLKGTGT